MFITYSPIFILILIFLPLATAISNPILSSIHIISITPEATIQPSSPSPSPTPNTIGLFKCPRSRIDDFFACNCHFLRVTGAAALLPDILIPQNILKGAIRSCVRQFGSRRALKQACLNIQKKRRRMFRFNFKMARRGMQRFIHQCV